MNLLGVPQEFHERVSDDGRHVTLKGNQLRSLPESLGNLTTLTALELTENQRLVAHEVDHLYGVLYRARMRPSVEPIPVSEYKGTGAKGNYETQA